LQAYLLFLKEILLYISFLLLKILASGKLSMNYSIANLRSKNKSISERKIEITAFKLHEIQASWNLVQYSN